MQEDIREILRVLTKHGECLARLDERSIGQDKRLNRIQQKAGGWGALAGTIVAFLVNFFMS